MGTAEPAPRCVGASTGPAQHDLPHTGRHLEVQPVPAAARSTLLLYTDGLIERRGESLDAGLTRLRQHAAAPAREPLPAFCDELLAGLLTERYPDDVALLTLRLPPPGLAALRSPAATIP
ncbi:SpoIIE family protein phosphatase [Streptomyces sp. NPDC004059]